MAENLTFEDRVFQGIVEQFFKPVINGWDMNGSPLTGPSPLMCLASALYRLHKDRLAHDIWAQLDLDDLAKKVADRFVEELARIPNRYEYDRIAARDRMNERVREKIAEELARRAIAKMDAEAEQSDEPAPS